MGQPTHRLEYVTTAGCADCRAFESLVQQVAPDYPDLEIREVPAYSERGMALSIERGVLRFPVVVFDDALIAVETISEAELRDALGGTIAG